jgi:hypothetical protein
LSVSMWGFFVVVVVLSATRNLARFCPKIG